MSQSINLCDIFMYIYSFLWTYASLYVTIHLAKTYGAHTNSAAEQK